MTGPQHGFFGQKNEVADMLSRLVPENGSSLTSIENEEIVLEINLNTLVNVTQPDQQETSNDPNIYRPNGHIRFQKT